MFCPHLHFTKANKIDSGLGPSERESSVVKLDQSMEGVRGMP